MAARAPIPKPLQVQVYRRDRWICQWCSQPVVFHAAMRLLENLTRKLGHEGPLAYYHLRWRRDQAPLLDWLGAVIDHKHAHAKGGGIEIGNLITACNKCNTRKSDSDATEHASKNPKREPKGKHGKPEHWDGFTSLFVVLADRDPSALSDSEREWFRVLTDGREPGAPQKAAQ
jgi:5-methylcytosine-specific restriction endonuclease McrA